MRGVDCRGAASVRPDCLVVRGLWRARRHHGIRGHHLVRSAHGTPFRDHKRSHLEPGSRDDVLDAYEIGAVRDAVSTIKDKPRWRFSSSLSARLAQATSPASAASSSPQKSSVDPSSAAATRPRAPSRGPSAATCSRPSSYEDPRSPPCPEAATPTTPSSTPKRRRLPARLARGRPGTRRLPVDLAGDDPASEVRPG
jgi:hypothetical protein